MRSWRNVIAAGMIAAILLCGEAFALPNTENAESAESAALTVTFNIGRESQKSDVISGTCPAEVPAEDAGGAKINAWRDAKGLPANPAEEPVTADTVYYAVFVPEIIKSEHPVFVGGDSGGMFHPNRQVTRAEFAQMLSNVVKTDPERTVSFSDVPAGKWYYKAVSELAGAGVVWGEDGKFKPAKTLTRAELAVILSVFCVSDESTVSFSDVAEDYWAHDAIASVASQGWMSGSGSGLFKPDAPVTRAQAVSVINRLLSRQADAAALNTHAFLAFTDVLEGSWYYNDVIEASIQHSAAAAEDGTEQWTGYKQTARPLKEGFYTFGQDLYYVAADGVPVTSKTLGNFKFDAKGRYTSGNTELDGYVKAALAKCVKPGMTQFEKLHAAYNYARDSFSYLRRDYYTRGYTGWEMKNALVMFQTGRGNCYCYASVFYYLSKQLGYDSNTVSGVVGTNSRPHGWVEISFDGVKYIFDTELEMAYRAKGVYGYNFFKMAYNRVPWPYVK